MTMETYDDVLSTSPTVSGFCDSNTGGLQVSNTAAVSSFLDATSTDCDLPQDLKVIAASLVVQPAIPYKSLKSIWLACHPSTRPSLTVLFSGANLMFSSPKPREKSEELKARLRNLAEASERKAYEDLVKDITPKKAIDEPFSSYKDQLGFGLHVVLTMFTGYLVGFATFRALFGRSPAMSAAGGILGLVGGMLVETFLFIIRTSNLDKKASFQDSKAVAFITRVKKSQ